MSPSVRLLENDDSFVTLQDIYEQQCISLGVAREEPLIQSSLKIRSVVARQGVSLNLLVIKKALTFGLILVAGTYQSSQFEARA